MPRWRPPKVPRAEISAHSRTQPAQSRTIALPHLHRLVGDLDESVNLAIRTGATVRFIASVESGQTLRVTSREGMAFPAYRTTGGMVLLAKTARWQKRAAWWHTTPVPGDDPPDSATLSRDCECFLAAHLVVGCGSVARGVTHLETGVVPS